MAATPERIRRNMKVGRTGKASVLVIQVKTYDDNGLVEVDGTLMSGDDDTTRWVGVGLTLMETLHQFWGHVVKERAEREFMHRDDLKHYTQT